MCGFSKTILMCMVLIHPMIVLAQAVNPLVDSLYSAWPRLQTMANKANNQITVLPTDSVRASKTLTALNQSTRNSMAAVVYHTGGILIDNAWIRIFGSGNDKLSRDLPGWNKNKNKGKAITYIADDAIGGYFTINDGGLGRDTGMVYYFSPKELKNRPLNIDYDKFLDFCFNADLDKFYVGLRWKNWKSDMTKINADQVFLMLPFIWNGAKQIDQRMLEIISAEEKYFLLQEEVLKGKTVN